MFTFETPVLTYSERVLFRIKDNIIRLFFVVKVLVLAGILLYFNLFVGAILCILFFFLLMIPYFIWSRVYITEWKVENDEVTIVYQNFNQTKTIRINKADLRVDLETSGPGISVSKMILTHKKRAENILVQPEIGRWFVENMKKLKEEYP